MDKFTKFLWFAAKKLAAGLVIVFLLISAGFIGYDSANVYVMVHDGMTQRMSVITEKTADATILTKYFTPDCIATDSMISGSVVPDGVNVQDYSYQSRIKKLWVWPWKSRTKITVRDEVSRLTLAPAEEGGTVPQTLDLGSGELRISLVKQNGRWYINGIERLTTQAQLDAEEAMKNPAPTPAPDESAEPSESQ